MTNSLPGMGARAAHRTSALRAQRVLPILLAIPLAILLATLPTTAAAQQIVPTRLQALGAVDLNENFKRVERYNAFVQAANQWRLSRARNRTKVAINSVATFAFLGLTAMQYTEAMRRLDENAGEGYDAPALISALSFGGAIWTGLKWWDARGDARTDAINERANVTAARALLLGVDPLRAAEP